MVIDEKSAGLAARSSKSCRKLRSHSAPQCGINSIQLLNQATISLNSNLVRGIQLDPLRRVEDRQFGLKRPACVVSPLAIAGHEQRNVFSVSAKEKCLLSATVKISQNAHPSIHCFVAITNRTEPDHVGGAVSWT